MSNVEWIKMNLYKCQSNVLSLVVYIDSGQKKKILSFLGILRLLKNIQDIPKTENTSVSFFKYDFMIPQNDTWPSLW